MSQLYKLRCKNKLSQSQLAHMTGISKPQISKYETGERDINKAQVQTLYKMSIILKCNIEDLIEKDRI